MEEDRASSVPSECEVSSDEEEFTTDRLRKVETQLKKIVEMEKQLKELTDLCRTLVGIAEQKSSES